MRKLAPHYLIWDLAALLGTRLPRQQATSPDLPFLNYHAVHVPCHVRLSWASATCLFSQSGRAYPRKHGPRGDTTSLDTSSPVLRQGLNLGHASQLCLLTPLSLNSHTPAMPTAKQ